MTPDGNGPAALPISDLVQHSGFDLRSMICSSVRPRSVRTVSVCSRWVGARCTRRGVLLNWTGLAARRIVVVGAGATGVAAAMARPP